MCAGITMYDPLQKFAESFGAARTAEAPLKGRAVAIVGLGGLGQMGIRLAKAMGAEVTVVSRSAGKRALAERCGADHFVVSTDPAAMAARARTVDIMLNTVPSYHDYVAFNPLLNAKGYQVLLGLHKGLGGAMVVNALTLGHSRVRMSGIGGIPNTEAVINLCDKFKIYPEVKVVPCSELNQVYTKLDGANDEGVRFVLDIANTLKPGLTCGAAPTISHASGTLSVGSSLKEGLWLFFTGKWL
jgi:uncharacterized zinc-type alcohol dehydrogenase-like protein